jgi:integrase
MALDIKDFVTVRNESNLKIHKSDNTKFIFDFRYENKRYRKTYKVSATSWDKKTCINDAKRELQSYKDDIEAGYKSTDKINLNKLFDLFAEDFDHTKRWTRDRVLIYNRYIKDSVVGSKELSKIREMDIKSIITIMNKKGLAPRTQKSILEVLRPLFKFAVKNKYIKENPISDLSVRVPSQKKPVVNATELFNKVFKGIISYYENDPFYQSLFLFALFGRRKSEILNLKWENINLTQNYYWIEKTKNSDNQQYEIPSYIKEQLLKLNDDKSGLVYKSPVTGKALVDISRQMNQLKKHTGIEQLTLHYMRNILVSMLAEQKMEAVTLSGILGHRNTNIINQYLSLNHYKSSQEGIKKIDNILEAEIVTTSITNG